MQALFQCFYFLIQSLGQMSAEAGEVFFDQGNFGSPAVYVYAQEFFYLSGLDVQAFRVQIGCIGHAAYGCVFGVDFVVAAFEDPFEDATVFAVAGPEELSVLILTEPVDVENLVPFRGAGLLLILS